MGDGGAEAPPYKFKPSLGAFESRIPDPESIYLIDSMIAFSVALGRMAAEVMAVSGL